MTEDASAGAAKVMEEEEEEEEEREPNGEAESGAKIPFTKPLDSRRSERHAGDPHRQRYLLRERQAILRLAEMLYFGVGGWVWVAKEGVKGKREKESDRQVG
ncbi:uncharacterized protein BO96DRAFT_351710 [Aspergillus niger CBS 101883]|uniref:uncharacterized protein n=1 Tax=Aspergillus lacticoffeatus (strain CBS 101883) TaxID=1450533 RepID=UPI000D7ECD2F|nr:uncharacterized protein BO96DRAFT_351710 [Aspergillus niger CBS 101883]PYH50818.1 hypothetical protein BO96DRAFT_351710 [Aspergillus niger CBS 101883]